MGLILKPSQKDRVLDILKEAQGHWVDGMIFYDLMPRITQIHTRMWELKREGYVIEGRFICDKNWKEYRLISEPIDKLPPAFNPKPEPLNTKQSELSL